MHLSRTAAARFTLVSFFALFADSIHATIASRKRSIPGLVLGHRNRDAPQPLQDAWLQCVMLGIAIRWLLI